MRLLKGLAALLALVGGVAGIPLALVLLGGNPLPATFSWQSLSQALVQPDDGSILISLITVVGWLAWLVFAVSVCVELLTLASGFRIRVRLPGLGGAQRLSAGLLLAVVAMVASPLPSVEAAVPAANQTTVSPPVSHGPAKQHATGSNMSQSPSRQKLLLGPAAAQSAAPAEVLGDRHVTHRVVPGDDLWSLAQHYYGEGRQWRKIAQANPQQLTGGPDRLEPGWKLVIPDVDIPATPPSGGPGVSVKAGDTLSSIAEKTYGDSARWTEIFAANRSQLSDPDELEVGIRLAIPDREQPKRDEPSAHRDHAGADTAANSDTRAESSSHLQAPPALAPKETAKPADQSTSREPQTTSSPAPTAVPQPGKSDPAAEDVDLVDVALAVGSVGGLLAAGLVAAVAARRRLQLQRRPLGRQIRHPSASGHMVETAMGRHQRPMSMRTLDLAVRAVAAHCHATQASLPVLAVAKVGPEKIELTMTERVTNVPAGFTVSGRTWALSSEDAHHLGSVPGIAEAVRPYPALVSLGSDEAGQQIVVDLEAMGLLSLRGDDPTQIEAAVAAFALELSFSIGADELFVTLVGESDDLAQALGKHNVTQTDDVDGLLTRLELRAAQQRPRQQHQHPGQNRVDPNLADPWAPEILLVTQGLTSDQERRLQSVVLDEPRVALAAVIAAPLTAAPWSLALRSASSESASGPTAHDRAATATLEPLGLRLVPQLVPATARHAVVDLMSSTGSDETVPAPWWDQDLDPPADPPPDNVTYLGQRSIGWGSIQGDRQGPSEREGAGHVTQQASKNDGMVTHHPVLLLLGPVELVGATGTPPSRAGKQCLEYCGWLLEHPGTTARAMASALVIAEGTRRSNMSRLRTWLGEDVDHNPYLPDAYSGKIFLHPSVSSDWHRLQILTTGGVNRTSTGSLRAALELVRGAPLADAAPYQWPWAEELRTDMVSVIRDIGVEVSQRALAEHDIDLARWAASRALLAAPGDELLLASRIKTEHRAGNVAETERLTLQLAAQARALGVDLDDETVILLQEVIEGRVRARMA